MSVPQNYERDKNGQRFVPGGIDTVHSLDALPPTKYAYLQNVRAYKQLQIIGRATQSAPVVSGLPNPVHSLRILNDTTPNGPVGGYVRVIGAAGMMYVNATSLASGLSGNPISLCPFRPNTSVEPWMYTGDPSASVAINTEFLINGTPTVFDCKGMTKIRSDGRIYKTGIKEPQIAPAVATTGTMTSGSLTLPANTPPWTNTGGLNTPSYNYSQTTTPGTGGVGGIVFISLPTGSQTIEVTISGSATVNGATHAPGDLGPTGPTFPGSFDTFNPATIALGVFTDSSGVVLPSGGPVPIVISAGTPSSWNVPAGATRLQLGIDSDNASFPTNSGSYAVAWNLIISSIATVVSTLGDVTTYFWGDSPHSGPVADYIWKNPNDSGSGIPRSSATATGSATNNSWEFDSTPEDGTVPVQWNTLASNGSVSGSLPLFTPALETEGYQDFNACVIGSIFIPAAGNYVFSLQYKDQIMLGFSAGATLVGSVAITGGGHSPGTQTGPFFGFKGQTKTVVSDLPLLYVGRVDGTTATSTNQVATFTVSFPATGAYQLEIDWDYWEHTGRSLILKCGGTSIPPLPDGVRTGVSYRYVYRSSATGATSNPSPESDLEVTPVLGNTVTPTYSDDPQVDKIDYYRSDTGLDNFTYVATGPNTNPPTSITDELTDIEVSGNPILEFDNYEPFPVTDLPRKGVVNVTGGVVTWVSGDQFNVRWLPGTEILIGAPTQLAYTFISRPVTPTSVIIPDVPDGANQTYEIPEPILAAQPLPYLWGPTDNAAYMFACGDPINPGTLYFTKGNNPDSAPETNQIPVTSPSEPLMNGCITAGLGMVFSTERRWLIYPTFTTALATVEGVAGSPFNLVLASSDRGLFIASCVCTDGGNITFFRAKDGIYGSAFGGGDEFLCEDIYNLFPREGIVPQPVAVAGFTIFPPDDTRPEAQKLSFATGYLYYDYEDVTGFPRTLVYDTISKGWSVDVGLPQFTTHALEEGPETNTVMVGCNDGTVRVLGSGNAENVSSVVMPGSQNAGDARANKIVGDVFIQALVEANHQINVAVYSNRYTQDLVFYSPKLLAGTGTLLPYVIDFTFGFGEDIIDVGVILTWPTFSGDIVDLWQATFIQRPENVQDRPTDWSSAGTQEPKFVQGVRLERDTFNQNKVFYVQSGDDFSLNLPNETPCNFPNQGIQTFSLPPFIAHTMRIISTDGVPWREWATDYIFQPYPSQCVEWSTELMNYGPSWQHIRMFNVVYIASAPVTMVVFFDQWPTITLANILPATPSQLYPVKTKVQMPANKTKLMGFTLTSPSRFRVFKPQLEVYVGPWGRTGPYELVTPFGGNASDGAEA